MSTKRSHNRMEFHLDLQTILWKLESGLCMEYTEYLWAFIVGWGLLSYLILLHFVTNLFLIKTYLTVICSTIFVLLFLSEKNTIQLLVYSLNHSRDSLGFQFSQKHSRYSLG